MLPLRNAVIRFGRKDKASCLAFPPEHSPKNFGLFSRRVPARIKNAGMLINTLHRRSMRPG